MAALIGTLNRFLWRVCYRDDPAVLLPCQKWKLSRGASDDSIPYLRTGIEPLAMRYLLLRNVA